MTKLHDDMIDIKTIERIMKRTERLMPQPEPVRYNLMPWLLAAAVVGLMAYVLAYDIAGQAVRGMGL